MQGNGVKANVRVKDSGNLYEIQLSFGRFVANNTSHKAKKKKLHLKSSSSLFY